MVVGTLLLGVIGVVAFMSMQPNKPKARSANKEKMKPRGARAPVHAAPVSLTRMLRAPQMTGMRSDGSCGPVYL